MRVLVFSNHFKDPQANHNKLGISKVHSEFIKLCTNSMKKYCEANNYDYCFLEETLGWDYFDSKWSNLCLEKYALASLRASDGAYDVVVITDSDFLAVSTEPLPYCPGFSAYKTDKTTKVYPVIPKKYDNYIFNTGIVIMWRDHLFDFAKYLVQICGVSGSKTRLPLAVLNAHDESFIAHYLIENPHINFNYLDYRFNMRNVLSGKISENPVFVHVGGNFKEKVQRFKQLPKEMRTKILR